MVTKNFRPVLIAMLILAGCARGADVSGRWDIAMDPDFLGHQTVEHAEIQQQNRAITVRHNGSKNAIAGQVSGRSVIWGQKLKTAALTATWSGTLDASGATMTGTWSTLFDDGSEGHGRFTGTKVPQ